MVALPALGNLFSVVFTVGMLATTVYFLLGSIPLLILKHDTPIDSSFIRSFFNLYYRVAMFVATGAALSYLASERYAFAAGAAVIALLATVLRRTVVAKMDTLKTHIHAANFEAIPEFRKIHFQAIQISFILLIVVVWSLFSFKL